MVLTVLAMNSGCSTGLVDKRSRRSTTPNLVPALRLLVVHTHPLLCVSARGTVGVHRPPDTWKYKLGQDRIKLHEIVKILYFSYVMYIIFKFIRYLIKFLKNVLKQVPTYFLISSQLLLNKLFNNICFK